MDVLRANPTNLWDSNFTHYSYGESPVDITMDAISVADTASEHSDDHDNRSISTDLDRMEKGNLKENWSMNNFLPMEEEDANHSEDNASVVYDRHDNEPAFTVDDVDSVDVDLPSADRLAYKRQLSDNWSNTSLASTVTLDAADYYKDHQFDFLDNMDSMDYLTIPGWSMVRNLSSSSLRDSLKSNCGESVCLDNASVINGEEGERINTPVSMDNENNQGENEKIKKFGSFGSEIELFLPFSVL